MKTIVVVLVALVLAGGPVSAAETQEPRAESSAEQAGRVAATALYMPLKAGLCVIGGASSLFTFLSSGVAAMRAVQRASCTGTWVLTREVMSGQEPLNFVGEIPMP